MAAAEVLGTAAIDILLRQKSLGSKQFQADLKKSMGVMRKVNKEAISGKSKWQRFAGSMEEFGRAMNKTSIILGIGGIVLKKFGENVIQASMGPLKAAAELQEELVNVSKTTNLAGSSLDKLGKNFRKLSTQMPISSAELANIAAALGQLGLAANMIKSDAVKALTKMSEVVAKLAVATDLSAEQAVLSIGKLGKSMGMTSQQITDNAERMGDVLNELSNTTSATAAQITKAMLNSASAASLLGIEFQDLAGINAILIQMGFEASRAGTLLKTALVRMASESEKFQKIFGVMISDETFKNTKNLEKSFTQLAVSMSKMSKTEAVTNLKDIVGLRAFQSIQKLAESTQIMTGNFDDAGNEITEFQRIMKEANDEWTHGGSLTEEYIKIIGTFNSKLILLSGTWKSIQQGVGKGLITVFGALITVLQKVLAVINLIPTPILSAFGALVGIMGLLVGSFAMTLGAISAFTSVITFAASNLTALKDTVIKAGIAFGTFQNQILQFEALRLFKGRVLLETSGSMKILNNTVNASKNHFRSLIANMKNSDIAIKGLGKGTKLWTQAMGKSGVAQQVMVKNLDEAVSSFKAVKKLAASKKMKKDLMRVFDALGTSPKDIAKTSSASISMLKKLRDNLDKGAMSGTEFDRTMQKITLNMTEFAQKNKKISKILDSNNEQLLANEGLFNLIKQNLVYSAVQRKNNKLTIKQAGSMGIFGLAMDNLKQRYKDVGGVSGVFNKQSNKVTEAIKGAGGITGIAKTAFTGLGKVLLWVKNVFFTSAKLIWKWKGAIGRAAYVVTAIIIIFKALVNIVKGIKEAISGFEFTPGFKDAIGKIGEGFGKIGKFFSKMIALITKGWQEIGKKGIMPMLKLLEKMKIIKVIDDKQKKILKNSEAQTNELIKQNEELSKSGSELDKLAAKFQKLISPPGAQAFQIGAVSRTTGADISRTASDNIANAATTATTKEGALAAATGSVVYNQNSVSMNVSVTEGDARRVAEIFADALNSPTSASVLQSIAPGGTSMITRV